MKHLKKIIIISVLVITSLLLLVIGSGYDMYKEALKEIPLNKKIDSIQQKENYTKLDEVPQIYKDAVIATEDHRFYKHHGIDIIAIGRAAFNDIRHFNFSEGGSTITQQLAKNIYFTQEKKITRKIAEVFMAKQIEKNYDKDKILELYINTSYFGDGYYTVKEASRGYFGKEPNEMTEYESIMLAGIPNAPSVYAPTVNKKLANKRAKQVIMKMVEYKYLKLEKANEILNSVESQKYSLSVIKSIKIHKTRK